MAFVRSLQPAEINRLPAKAYRTPRMAASWQQIRAAHGPVLARATPDAILIAGEVTLSTHSRLSPGAA
jgi:hypothetical protein